MSTNPASLAVTSAGSLSDVGRKPRDSRTFRRYGAAVLLVVSALTVAVNRVVAPGLLEDDGIAILREAAASPERTSAAVWLGVVSAMTLLPAFLVAARMAMRRRPVLATWALVVNGAAYLGAGLAFHAMGPLIQVAAEQPEGQYGVLANYLNEFSDNAVSTLSAALFIVGHLIGGVLMGLALRGTIPTPAWVAIAVAMPAHFVVYVLLQNLVLDALAWGLMALGFVVCAVIHIRMPNDEWEPAPLRAR